MSRHVPRLFCEHPLSDGARVRLDKGQSHHFLHVLRLKPGADLLLFDGRGGEYPARLSLAGKGQAVVEVGTRQAVARESIMRVCLGQALSRGERMDYTLQKAVELGVTEIQPLASERSQKIDPSRQQKKLQHWQAVVVSAAEQCGRDRVPIVHAPRLLMDWITSLPLGPLKLMLDPAARQGLRPLGHTHDVVLLSGPEGGFSETEVDTARQSGFTGIRLGPRVLRTETAAIAAIAALQTLWGDLAE